LQDVAETWNEAAQQEATLEQLEAQAQELLEAGEWLEALDCCTRMMRLDPARSATLKMFNAAKNGLDREQDEERKRRRLTEQYQTGLALLAEAKWKQALDAFKAVSKDNPDFRDVQENLAQAQDELQRAQWYDEAIAHLQRGLALLKAVPMSRERLHLELDLCTAISTPAMLQRGWGAPVHAWALERLSDLSRHPDLQDDPRCLTALSALVLSSGWSADPERSGRVGNQLLSLAQEGDRQSLVLAHWALGFSHWLPGQLVTAREHLEQALALYDLEANRPLRRLVAADPGVMAQAMLGSVLWLLGYAGQGRAGLLQAVAQAEALDHPSSAAFAHWLAATMTFVVGRDVAAALHHAEALRSLGQVSLVYGVWAELVPELAKAQEVRTRVGTAEGELEHGVARAVKAGSTWQSAGSGTGYVCLLLAQAEMHARAGQPEMGLETMDRAQAWIERTGVRILEADTWRMRAELLLMADDGRGTIDDRRPTRDERRETKDARETALSVEAETCFQRALAIAREQEARWLELRAAVTLGRLWSSQGRRAEARELLSGVYGWFTEGFNTPDLKQAKSLLEALSS